MLLRTPRGRKLLFAGLYMAEGAPMGFLWWALPVRLRSAGVDPERIATLVSVLVIPWALKLLWAPLVDVVRSKRWTVRSWILSAQVLMALTLAPLLVLDLHEDYALVVAALVLHAVFAATQDAAIDTLAIGVITLPERGAVNGWMQVGMLTSRALFGGGALLLGNRIGDQAVVALLIAVVLGSSMLLVLGVRAEDLPGPDGRRSRRVRDFAAHLRTMVRRRTTWIGLAFAVFAGAGFKSATALAGPFLVDRGIDSDTVGFFFLLPSVTCMALGAVAGGTIADRLSRRLAVGLFEALAALVVAAVGIAATLVPAPHGVPLLLAMLAVLYFTIGLATAAAYAMFMDLTDPRLAATQFCTFMAGINLCEAWSTRTLGRLVSLWGYGPALCVMTLPSLAALSLLRWIPGSTLSTESAEKTETEGDHGGR